MKMPAVTNSVGAEGICAKSGRDYVVSDNPIEIASTVDELLCNPAKAAEMGEYAGKFAYEHFKWGKVLEVYKELG